MRLYTMVLFMLCFSLVNSLVTEMEIFPDGSTTVIVDEDKYAVQAEELKDEMTDVSGDVSGEFGADFGLIGFTFRAAGVLVNTFTFFIWGFAGLLISCGVPTAISVALQTIAFFIMAIGTFEILTGRGFKSYE